MRPYIIADNQHITREGIVSVLTKNEPDVSIFPATGKAELLQGLMELSEPVVVLDYALMDFQSAHQLLNMMAGSPEASWLLFFDELSEQFLRQVLISAPELSAVSKHDPLCSISAALKAVQNRERYVCELAGDILNKGIPPVKVPDVLTAAEKSVLREIALGKTTKEIAVEKFLSFHTINTHRRNIFRKLDVNNAQEAVRYAIKAGIIDFAEYYI